MTAITWEIPAAQVLTLNRLPRDRHALDARKKQIRALADRQLPAMPEPCLEMVAAHWTIRYGKGTTPKADPVNCAPTTKILLDSCVTAGILTDDSPQFIAYELFARGPNLDVRGLYWVTLTLTPSQVRYELAGVCPACGEPVTTRQTRQTWRVNLYAFDRDQPVTFHLRRQCEREAMEYDRACMADGQPSQLGQGITFTEEK